MFSLTRQEKQVILFLLTIAFIGLGVDFLAKRYSPLKTIAYFNQGLGKVDLNSADKALLISIPGIGEKLAERIIRYRAKQGSFKEASELKNIRGISDNKYELIKDYLTAQ